jgi:hypothetical protein
MLYLDTVEGNTNQTGDETMTNENDIATTSTLELRNLADDLKQDAKLYFENGKKHEALQLFRLFKKLAAEIHRRKKPDWN